MPNTEAQNRYQKEKTRIFTIKVIRNTESDVLEKLESVPNVSGYIKSLIRKDIGSLPKQTTD